MDARLPEAEGRGRKSGMTVGDTEMNLGPRTGDQTIGTGGSNLPLNPRQ